MLRSPTYWTVRQITRHVVWTAQAHVSMLFVTEGVMRNATYFRMSWICPLILLTAANLFGQATSGSIFGSITDASGAAVPNAKVTIANIERGTVRTVNTDNEGQYALSNVDLGTYTVSVEAGGFKRATNPAVTMTVKARIQVDTVLEVGESSQTVEVTSTAPLIKTGTAEVSNVISRQQLHDLPILSRNLLSIAALSAGTNGGHAASRQAAISGAALVANGAPAESNNFIIDGVSSNMEFSGTISTMPPIDAVQEVSVQTSQFSAEFGHSAGAVVNIALKSGTNAIHGFAYDYLQNDLLNARPYDFTGANQPKQALRRNQFGGGAGGPLIKDRIFWFGNYEGLRAPLSSLGQYIVPTALEKTGDFSKSGYNIFDLTTAHPDPANPSATIRDQFPGNVIPSNRITAAGRGMVNYFPDPNFVSPNPAIRNNYLIRQNSNESQNLYNAKGDFILSPADTLIAHATIQKRNLSADGWLPNDRLSSNTSVNGVNSGINYTRVLSPTLVNEVRASYNRMNIPAVLDNTENVVDAFNIPGWRTNPIGRGFPTVSVANLSAVAPIREIQAFGPPFTLIENTYQLLDMMSWQKGSHSIKFGVEINNQRDDRYQARSGGGQMTFNGSYSTQRQGDAVQTPRTGVADFLLGNSSALLTQYGFDAIRIRAYRFNAFVQDDWRVTSKLTLNLGLRYDVFQPYRETQDRFANFDLATGTRLVPETARVVVQNTLGLPNGDLPAGWKYVPVDQVIPRTNWKDLSPRVGLAYALNKKFVLRAGYGIFYTPTTSNTFNNSGTEGNPFFFDFQMLGDAATPLTFNSGFPSGGISNVLASPSFSAYYGPLKRLDPYAQKYSATVEWNPLQNTAVSIGYIGQKTFRFPTLASGNQAQQPAASSLVSRQPYPNVGSFWLYVPAADSNYNGLIVSVNQRLTHGFTVQSTFTHSKALGLNTGTDSTLTNRWNYRYDYSPIDYDIRDRWVTSFTYQVPTASGMNAFAKAALGGWAISGILTVQSGFPFSATASGAVINVGQTGGTGNRPDVIGNPALSNDERNANRWFNTAAFAAPAPYTWGNAGKNILRGPGLINLDTAFQKSFPIVSERQRLTLRMEMSNFFNHVHLGNPSGNLSVANFGVITGLQSPQRKMQAALRYEF